MDRLEEKGTNLRMAAAAAADDDGDEHQRFCDKTISRMRR